LSMVTLSLSDGSIQLIFCDSNHPKGLKRD
jgi:hypothetical protein